MLTAVTNIQEHVSLFSYLIFEKPPDDILIETPMRMERNATSGIYSLARNRGAEVAEVTGGTSFTKLTLRSCVGSRYFCE